ncbi:trypsin-like serine protease [Thalassomonas viridans]|uniref:Trypsin-like serine protease n=1 Tax=Thalassomonas viridans TaxID=137584 RepID=A0AAE9Z5V4_9GAMM|nr:trypsin-like serine protease [Thalassomonas viridans]WDE07316.1 trypsin-like serine protease [Thalassomonas viridans]
MKIIDVMKNTLFTLGCLLTLSFSAKAITNGELAGDNHPAVVLLLMEAAGAPVGRCTGTLLSPTVVLTAGHCTREPGEFSAMRVFTESDVRNGNNYYPFSGPNSVEAISWASHPNYTNADFTRYDVGIVTLQEPGIILDSYPNLPEANQFDQFTGKKGKKGKKKVSFTTVGYGLQETKAGIVESDLLRMFTTQRLKRAAPLGRKNDFFMLLGGKRKNGGACVGDSGGPNFFGDSKVIAAVTSFSQKENCKGTSGVFRLDRINVLTFIESYL